MDAGASEKSLSGRPALAEALAMIRSGDADVLVVSKLDRLSRSLLDFAGLMAHAQARGWMLFALDLGICPGVRLGRPPVLPQQVAARIVADRESGMSLSGIAEMLNAGLVSTARGGARWYAATVQAVLRSQAAAEVR